MRDWTGAVVKIKPKWLDSNEDPDRLYIVVEDRGNTVVVRLACDTNFIPHMWHWDKDWCFIVQNKD